MGPLVVLAGSPAVDGRALGTALRARGMGPVVEVDLHEFLLVATGPGPVVVVAGHEHLGRLRRSLDEADGAAGAGGAVLVGVADGDGVQACVAALRSGAVGVLAPGAGAEEAVAVVRSAAAGRLVLPERVARAVCCPASSVPPLLGPQELRWLRALGQGVAVAALAEAEGCPEQELYRRLSGVYARLGAANRTEALLRAQRWGLLDG